MDKYREMNTEDKFTAFVLFTLFLSLIFLGLSWQGHSSAQNEYQEKLAGIEKIKLNNEKVEKQTEEQAEKLGIVTVQKQSKKFYDLFFNWNSWQRYTDNMLEIQNEFPQLQETAPVDITGTVVGTGASPISSYDSKSYVTSEQGKILTMIVQLRNTATTTTTTTWRGITHIDNSLLYVDELETFSKLQ